MARILTLIALLLLGGCTTLTDTHSRYLHSKCAISGLAPDSAAHAACFSAESEEWQRKTWADGFH